MIDVYPETVGVRAPSVQFRSRNGACLKQGVPETVAELPYLASMPTLSGAVGWFCFGASTMGAEW